MSDPQSQVPAPPAAPEPTVTRDDASAQALAAALRSSFVIIKLVMIGLVVAFLASGFFTVGPQEKAVILRFGKPVSEDEHALLGPGAHWAFPYPIDEVVRIPVGEVQTVTSSVGWYFTTPAMEAAKTEPRPDPTLNPAKDGYVLTGDGSIVHARATLRYRIAEPGLRYRFDFVSPSNLVQNALNNALQYAAARSTVEITRDTTVFREQAAAHLDQLIASQKLGILVDQLSVQVIPPRQLTADFEKVGDAEVKRGTALSDARRHENETVSRARASASARQSAAEAERKGFVELVAAEAKRFSDLLPEYRKNPQLFLDLRHAEAMQRIYPNIADKVVLPQRADGLPRELRLLLNRPPEKPRLIEVPKPHEDKH